MKHIKFYLTMILSTMLVLIGVIAEGAITSGQPISGNYMTGMKSVDNENLIINPTPYKTDTGIAAGTGMTITRATTTAAFRFQNQAYWAVQSSTQGACREFSKRTPYGPLLNGQCMAGLMFNGDATGYSIRIENSTGGILAETPLDFVSGYTKAFTSGVTCGDNSERVVKICRTASGTGATFGVGEVFYGAYDMKLADVENTFTARITETGVLSTKTGPDHFSGNATITDSTLFTINFKNLTSTPTCEVTTAPLWGTTGILYTAMITSHTASSIAVRILSQQSGTTAKNASHFNISCTRTGSDYVPKAQLADRFGGVAPNSIARRVTNQNVNTTSPTIVQLDYNLKDNAGMINTSTYETTIKSDGDYSLGYGGVIVNGTIGERFTFTVYVNGAATFMNTAVEGLGADSAPASSSFPNYPLKNGDKLTLLVSSNADTSYTVSYATLGVTKLTPPAYAIPFGDRVPAGAVSYFLGTNCPTDWLALNTTQNLSRTEFPMLFAQAGTAHGAGDGSTTFGVPNIAGIKIRAAGSQTYGSKTYTGTVNQKRNDNMISHTHPIRGADGTFIGASGTTSTGFVAGTVNAGLLNTFPANPSQPTVMGPAGAGSETNGADIALIACVKVK